jgi:hypothetical protein
MHKVLNILSSILVLLFFWGTYKYYSSNTNLKIKDFNRINIDKIIKQKISNLPILTNDTNDAIEFNNSMSSEIKNSKPRSFWNLLKSK